MTYALVIILSIALVAFLAWPLLSPSGPSVPDQASEALAQAEEDLALSLEAIREIDMDHRARNLSDEDFGVLDREERARAVDLMRRRDAMSGTGPAE